MWFRLQFQPLHSSFGDYAHAAFAIDDALAILVSTFAIGVKDGSASTIILKLRGSQDTPHHM